MAARQGWHAGAAKPDRCGRSGSEHHFIYLHGSQRCRLLADQRLPGAVVAASWLHCTNYSDTQPVRSRDCHAEHQPQWCGYPANGQPDRLRSGFCHRRFAEYHDGNGRTSGNVYRDAYAPGEVRAGDRAYMSNGIADWRHVQFQSVLGSTLRRQCAAVGADHPDFVNHADGELHSDDDGNLRHVVAVDHHRAYGSVTTSRDPRADPENWISLFFWGNVRASGPTSTAESREPLRT